MSLDKVTTELGRLLNDTSNNGVSEYCAILITMLRSGALKVADLQNKTLMMPNNWCMREWKNKSNMMGIVKAHIRPCPVVVEYDKTKFGNLTRTWAIPMKLDSLHSYGMIVSVILPAEGSKSKSMKKSKSKSRSSSKSKSSKSKSKSRKH